MKSALSLPKSERAKAMPKTSAFVLAVVEQFGFYGKGEDRKTVEKPILGGYVQENGYEMQWGDVSLFRGRK